MYYIRTLLVTLIAAAGNADAFEARKSPPLSLSLPLRACEAGEGRVSEELCYLERSPLLGVPLSSSPLFDDEKEVLKAVLTHYADEPWANKGDWPQIGLALSGGGSKTAPFAVGVLKRFVDQGWLKQVDLLSSVSGGGYAAYFLYTQEWGVRRAGATAKEPLNKRFLDLAARCVAESHPNECREDEPDSVSNKSSPDYRRCAYNPDIIDHSGELKCTALQEPSQRHLEDYQDILSHRKGGDSTTTHVPPLDAYAALVVGTGISLPFHHVANSLFNWRVGLSPTVARYRSGIGHTYSGSKGGWKDFSYSALRDLYSTSCPAPCTPMPWWVVNSTNAVPKELRTDLRHTVFEITPTSFGSDHYGQVRGVGIDVIAPDMTPLDAVVASAAFFDSTSAGMKRPMLVTGGLHLVNLRWGAELPNYRVSETQRRARRFLPWPLYYAVGFRRGLTGSHIRLADGGHSGDNLGVLSLLRRGTRHIVIADGAQDIDRNRYSSIPELCAVDAALRGDGLGLHFTQLPSEESATGARALGELCNPHGGGLAKGSREDFSPYKWRTPVWRLTVCMLGSNCNDNGAQLTDANGIQRALHGIQLYYLKSAVNSEDDLRAWDEWRAPNSEVCRFQIDDPPRDRRRATHAMYGMPCGLLAYRIDSGLRDPETWQWPQTSTVWTTADSSANRFQAYRDLGWYVSGRLACEKGSVFHDGERCGESMGRKIPLSSRK